MAWDPIDEDELAPGFAILKHVRQAWNCLKHLYGNIGTLSTEAILNGSLEIDSDADGLPDNWTLSTYPGGSGVLDATAGKEGVNAFKLIHPGGTGNGGGYLESDYVPCTGLRKAVVEFIHWSTAAGMHNQVIIRWFNSSKVYISESTAYDSTSNPTSAIYFVCAATPPAGSKFYKVRLVGGKSDVDVAGTAYFDGIHKAGADSLHGVQRSFTIAEQSASPGSYVDVGSASFQTAFPGIPIRMSFPADIYSGNGTDVYMRFRCGSNYSNETVTASLTYVTDNFILTGTANAAGSITVYMQLKGNGGVYGRKTDSTNVTRIDTDTFAI